MCYICQQVDKLEVNNPDIFHNNHVRWQDVPGANNTIIFNKNIFIYRIKIFHACVSIWVEITHHIIVVPILVAVTIIVA